MIITIIMILILILIMRMVMMIIIIRIITITIIRPALQKLHDNRSSNPTFVFVPRFVSSWPSTLKPQLTPKTLNPKTLTNP